MTRRMTARDVKAKLLALLDEVECGDEIVITRRGFAVARLVPSRDPHALLGRLRGIATSAASDEELFSTGEWERK